MIEQISSGAALVFLLIHYFRIRCMEEENQDGTTVCEIETPDVSGTCRTTDGQIFECTFQGRRDPLRFDQEMSDQNEDITEEVSEMQNDEMDLEDEPSTSTSTAERPKRTRKSCRPGVLTKSGWINFIREVRGELCGLTQPQIFQEAGKRWRALTEQEKSEYKSLCGSGKVTRNAFFNFCREVRGRSCGRKQTEIVKEASMEWKTLPKEEKEYYEDLARRMQRRFKNNKAKKNKKNKRNSKKM